MAVVFVPLYSCPLMVTVAVCVVTPSSVQVGSFVCWEVTVAVSVSSWSHFVQVKVAVQLFPSSAQVQVGVS